MLFATEREERIICDVSMYFSSDGNSLTSTGIFMRNSLPFFQQSKSLKPL